MKLPSTIYDLRFAICKKSGRAVSPLTADSARGVTRPAAFNRQSSVINHKFQKGFALVITLILLSVTLLMALAFLAISKRERGSVTTSIDTATARNAADAGRSLAEAQIAANILSSTNPYSFGLIVSTNYLPRATGNPLQDLTNLQYSPRAPVWLSNIVTHAMENRFYLDLNRNGADEPNGFVPEINWQGQATGNTLFLFGDPEWIGVLARPDLPYGPNNPFIARYAVIALPVGNSLDFNAIHNQALSPASIYKGTAPLPIAPDYYARNQGAGSWELNLAAFLTDLNTNEWNPPGGDSYNYEQPQINTSGNIIWGSVPNSGRGFEDAFVLLTNRYAGLYNTLPSVAALFGAPGVAALANDNIDFYSAGTPANTPMTGVQSPNYNQNGVGGNAFWLGANNTNHFFTPDDLFNPAESSVKFTNSLISAGFSNATYDRYTFYRMLSQIGTDTTPDSGKMNLNYDNLDPFVANGIIYPPSATNFMAWTPLGFFTNAADRMLRAYTTLWSTSYVPTNGGAALMAVVNSNFVATFNVNGPFGVTNIPVLVSNQFVYTPAVQRVLQLAANLFDASTNSFYPSVFRPLFTTSTNGNVFITGYTSVPFVTNFMEIRLAQPIDVETLSAMSETNLAINVYGVPWIVGAKKGFPNFNAFQMENIFKLTRKLQLTRTSTNVNYATNPNAYTNSQQITIWMTNMFGVECWNSYQADFTNGLVEIQVKDTNTVTLTNDEGLSYSIGFSYTNTTGGSDWPGYGPSPTLPNPSSFIWQPLRQGEYVLPGWIYTFNTNAPFVAQAPSFFVTNSLMPHWTLLVTNRLQVVMLDVDAAGTSHVIDYVQLIGPENSVDLTAAITNLYDTYYDRDDYYRPGVLTGYNDMWDPIVSKGVPNIPLGIANQIAVSAQMDPIIYSPYWNGSGLAPVDVTNQTAAFRAFLGFGQLPGIPPTAAPYIAAGKSDLTLQAPYTPTATVACLTQWEVNDPLVHYLASDLSDSATNAQPVSQAMPLTLGGLNDRYRPWGGTPQLNPLVVNATSFDYLTLYDRTIKDPLVWSSDYWNFPTNKYPTTGWMGRVHRGTPWQTVYLKSSDVVAVDGLGTWTNWTGNRNYFDAANASPTQDRLLFDLFTTAFDDNASRGTLSVNAGSTPDAHDIAAWSALFSGIIVPTNLLGGYSVINPVAVDVANGVAMGMAPTNSPLWQLASGIVGTRAAFINPDGLQGVFEHAGSILGTPQLTEQSPFLYGLNPTNQISDEMYEWLPQQIMSLLRVGTPRYVIYSYGQALRPAKNGVYLGAGQYFGMVTNYQVAAEIATRTVVRVDTMRTNTASGAVTVTPPHAVIESFNVLPPD